jgi:hypothetical protein
MKCLIDSPPAHPADTKLLLLDEAVAAGSLGGLPEGVAAKVQAEGWPVVAHDVAMGYEQLQLDEVLRVRTRASRRAACCQAAHCADHLQPCHAEALACVGLGACRAAARCAPARMPPRV